MPPMWSAPVAGDGRLRARRWGRWACAGAAVGARRARRARVRSAGVMGSVSWPGRGARATSPASWACCGVMRPGGPGWGRWVLRGAVEAVDPSPGGSATQSARGCRPGWRSRVWPKRSFLPWVVGLQGLWRRGVRRPGSARAPAGRAGDSAPAGARDRAVVGRAGAGCAPRAAAPLSKTSMAAWPAIARGDQPGHRQAPVVVLEPARSPPCARRPGRTRRHPGPPAGVGGGAGRTGATPPSVSWTARPRPAPSRPVDPWPATPARAPQGPWRPSSPARADRTAAPVPSAPGAARTSRARARTRSGRRLGPASRTARPGPARRRGPLPPARAGARRRSVLAPDALLGAKRRHRPAGRVIGPSGDRQTNTGTSTAVLIGAHPSIPNHECHHQDTPKCHRCPDTELSPMS